MRQPATQRSLQTGLATGFLASVPRWVVIHAGQYLMACKMVVQPQMPQMPLLITAYCLFAAVSLSGHLHVYRLPSCQSPSLTADMRAGSCTSRTRWTSGQSIYRLLHGHALVSDAGISMQADQYIHRPGWKFKEVLIAVDQSQSSDRYPAGSSATTPNTDSTSTQMIIV